MGSDSLCGNSKFQAVWENGNIMFGDPNTELFARFNQIQCCVCGCKARNRMTSQGHKNTDIKINALSFS